MNHIKKYLKQRKFEVEESFNDDARSLLDTGYRYIDLKMNQHHSSVTPMAARNIEMLEYLLFALIEHAEDPSLLEESVEVFSESIH